MAQTKAEINSKLSFDIISEKLDDDASINFMNVRLLRRIQKQILKEPRQFDMAAWFIFNEGIPNCNTAACIAGWAVSLTLGKTPLQAGKVVNKHFTETVDCVHGESARKMHHRANKALGLTRSAAMRLYSVNFWPSLHREQWWRACTPRAQAKIACRRIDHFIKTKGAE